jgi:hypothetical protein
MKLNTGLVAIIASFLNHEQKGGKSPLNIDFKSLTNLSDASRREALQSMTQLYQRISQSQLQLQQIGPPSCASCGSKKHTDCLVRTSTSSSRSSKDKKGHTRTRPRAAGPTITRMPVRSSNEPRLVQVRPKPSSKSSSSKKSSSSSSKSPPPSKSPSPLSSAYTSPLASPLPLYIAEEPFEIETNGVITGVLGGSVPLPGLSSSGRRRKDSFNVHDVHPGAWPEDNQPSPYKYPYVLQEHLNLPAPKLPTFTPTPRNPKPSNLRSKPVSPAPRSPEKPLPTPPAATLPFRRRMDKMTPTCYTFASDSTKLGEIPQRNWTTPWDYEEADRLNNVAATTTYAAEPVTVDEKVGRKKGIFKWMRKGSGAGLQ